MLHYMIVHCEGRCAPFVWMQGFFFFLTTLTRSFALPLAGTNLCPHPDEDIAPSTGREAAGSHVSPIFLRWGVAGHTRETTAEICLPGGAQGRSLSENWAEKLIISTAHHHRSLSGLFSPTIIRGHYLPFFSLQPLSLSFFFQFYGIPCTASRPLHSHPLACQRSLCNNCRWGSADEAMHMHAQSFSWDHGREWYDLQHHSPYLQIPSWGTVNNPVTFTD